MWVDTMREILTTQEAHSDSLFTTTQKKNHDRKEHQAKKPQRIKRTGKTVSKECEICGIVFDANADYTDVRKHFTCSATCRGHLYRNIGDKKLIEKCIKTNQPYTLQFTIRRILDLGFTIKIS